MKYTRNLNLKKPEANDFIDIEDINNNMDEIDEKYRGFVDHLESELGKYETKSMMIAATIFTSGWSDGQYSFEESYPKATYDLSVEPDSTCTETQLDAWSGARIVGNSAGNVLKAFGDVPTVDIPVILEVRGK